jgi:hypothetical protein
LSDYGIALTADDDGPVAAVWEEQTTPSSNSINAQVLR